MKKIISTCLISACAITPNAFAAIGSGLYFTAGAGAGFLEVNELQSFDLDYQMLYSTIFVEDELNKAVLTNFNNSAVYEEESETVWAGRAAIGYLWDFYDGEPTKVGDDIYTIKATLGLEVGYRLFDNADSELSQVEPTIFPGGFDTFETVTTKTSNQAVDLLAVLRLPFMEDSRLAVLFKGGIAYNMYDVDTTIDIVADLNPPPAPAPLPYNRTVHQSEDHNELLPVVAGALEYMFFDNFGVSIEYNAIFGSDVANSQLLIGNLVVRI